MANQLTVRAVDVGYGHIKFTDGRDPGSKAIRTHTIPSQSPLFAGEFFNSGSSIMASSPSDLSWPDGEQLNRGVVLAGFLAVLSVFLGFSRLFHS